MMGSLQDLYLDQIEYQARVRKAEQSTHFYQGIERKSSWQQWFQTLTNRSVKASPRTNKPARTRQQPA